MGSAEIRDIFLDFFKSKAHIIVLSAPIVTKNDPTLLFTNAGINQFKDNFLGNKQAPHRISVCISPHKLGAATKTVDSRKENLRVFQPFFS